MISTGREWLHRVDSGPFAATHRSDGIAPFPVIRGPGLEPRC